jgi:CheY-like chemotaxis protein
MQAVLEQRGATVLTADSVASALELFDDQRPDVIVSDIAMPEEDGYALVQRLRARSPENGGETPVVALSAYAAKSDRVRALSAGFTQYLHKPVDFEELVSTIQSVVKK